MFGNRVKKDKVMPYINEMYEYIQKRKERTKITKGEKEALEDMEIIVLNMSRVVKEG